jgi:hypothetical protein
VLLRVELKIGQADVLGWLTGWQALERPDGDDYGCKRWYGPPQNSWYVSRPFHSFASLEDYIESGRKSDGTCKPRPMWMPEDFSATRPDTDRRFPFAVEEL